MKRILATAGTLALAAGLTLGMASAASASVKPVRVMAVSVPAASTGALTAGPGSTASELHSNNWAGYVHTGGGTFASANWTVPPVHGGGGNSVSWVGLDGYGSPTVEQTGTEMGMIYGQPIFSAWVELFPAPWQTLQYQDGSDAPVYAGDHMSASVSADGDNYTIKLTDHTRNWYYAQTLADPEGTNASAEVITEAPALNGNLQLLANFGSEHFTSTHMSGNGTRTTMVARNGRTKAYVTGSQKSFTVHFKYAGVQN